jgi:hypothetical protein
MKTLETRSRRLTEALAVAGVIVGMIGCPQPMQDTPDAFRAPDAFVALDAGTDGGPDAPVAPDAFIPPDATFDGGPPDAAGPPCPTEGRTRMIACSCLGARTETCIAGTWRQTMECQGPLGYECEPGMTTPVTMTCSMGIRTCDSSCHFGPIVYTVLPGACEPGDEIRCGGCVCRDDCTCPARGADGMCLP